MAVKPEKLKALVDKKSGAKPEPMNEMPERSDEEEARLRAPEVNYMELKGDAGGFSCGKCEYAPTGSGDLAQCEHEKVNAPVSAGHGCCNLFSPTDEGALRYP